MPCYVRCVEIEIFFELHSAVYWSAGSIAGCPWEGDHVSDIAHAGDELNQSFKTETKAGVGHRAVPAQIQVPAVFFQAKPILLHAGC
jgi:hypothetical protein